MSGPVLVRVDNRLVHGQVLEAWLPAVAAQAILVADELAASNALVRSAMALAMPPKVSLLLLKPGEASALLASPAGLAQAERTLVLVRDVAGAAALVQAGVRLPRLNLGNVHFTPGRRQVSPSVYLDARDLQLLEEVEAAGTVVEARAVPGEQAVGLAKMKERFERGYP